MLHIILLILKIILWIIVGLLGLVLALLLLVLLSPICYRADASYHGGKTMVALVKVNYLIVSLRVCFDQSKGQLDQVIRVCGIRIGGKKEKPRKEKTRKEKIKKEKTRKVNTKTEKVDEPKIESEKAEDVQSSVLDTVIKSVDEFQAETEKQEDFETYDVFDDNLSQDVPEEEQKKKGRVKKFFVALWEKLKAFYTFLQNHTPDKVMESVEKKAEGIKKKVLRLKKFWNLSCTVKTRAYLKKYIKTFFKHILPRRIKGNVHYGMDEPYKTAKVTGYLSLMPFMYKKGFTLEPDFYNKVIEFDIKLKGRITLGYLLRIVLNINLWRTIKVAKKVMSK